MKSQTLRHSDILSLRYSTTLHHSLRQPTSHTMTPDDRHEWSCPVGEKLTLAPISDGHWRSQGITKWHSVTQCDTMGYRLTSTDTVGHRLPEDNSEQHGLSHRVHVTLGDERHWVAILMGIGYRGWWVSHGACHHGNHLNSTTPVDTHWVMTITGWRLSWVIRSLVIGHWSLNAHWSSLSEDHHGWWWLLMVLVLILVMVVDSHTDDCHWVMALPLDEKSLGDASRWVMDDRWLTFAAWRLAWWWRSLITDDHRRSLTISIRCFLSWSLTIVLDD